MHEGEGTGSTAMHTKSSDIQQQELVAAFKQTMYRDFSIAALLHDKKQTLMLEEEIPQTEVAF